MRTPLTPAPRHAGSLRILYVLLYVAVALWLPPAVQAAGGAGWEDPVERAHDVHSVDAGLFYLKAQSAYDQPRLFMRAGLNRKERLLLDPLKVPGERGVHAIDFFTPSPDGRWVAVGLSRNGVQGSVLRVLRVAGRRFGPERITRTRLNDGVAWLPDSSGFLYNRLADEPSPAAEAPPARRAAWPPRWQFERSAIWLHRLGRPEEDDVAVLGWNVAARLAFAPADQPRIMRTPGSPWLLAEVTHGRAAPRSYHAVRVTDLNGTATPWQPVIGPQDHVVSAVQSGGAVYGLVRGKGRRTAVLRWDLGTSGPGERVALPGALPRRLEATDSAVFIQASVGASSRVLRLATQPGARPQTLRLPFDGTVRELVPRGPGVLVHLESPQRPAAWWSVVPGQPSRGVGLQRPADPQTSALPGDPGSPQPPG